jgi:hypothetical protein
VTSGPRKLLKEQKKIVNEKNISLSNNELSFSFSFSFFKVNIENVVDIVKKIKNNKGVGKI